MNNQFRFIRRKELPGIVGLSLASIYRMVKAKTFPAPLALTGGRAVGWRSDAIQAFMDSRLAVAQ